MQMLYSRLNAAFGRLPNGLLRRRWTVLSLFVAISVLMAWGSMTRFEMNLSPEAWFQDNSPVLLDRREYRRQFGSDEDVFIIFRPQSGDVFSEQALRTLLELHQELEKAALSPATEGQDIHPLTHIVQVDSLLNARYQIADGDTLITRKLIGNDFPATPQERETRRARGLSQDDFKRVFFSGDFRYGGIRLKTDFGTIPVANALTEQLTTSDDLLLDDSFSTGMDSSGLFDADVINDPSADSVTGTADVEFAATALDEYHAFMTELRRVTQQAKYSEFDFYFVGNPVSMDFTATSIIGAGGLLLAMILIIVFILWSLFHSLSAVIWPMLIIVLSAFWMIGFGSWLGLIFSTTILLTLTLVLAVGIASCVHIFSSYKQYCEAGNDHQAAMTLAYKKTGAPIMLTSATTMAGMFSLVLSDMPVIQSFAILSGTAVAFTFMFTMVLLPLLLQLWHPKIAGINTTTDAGKAKPTGLLRINFLPLLRAIGPFTQRHSKTIVISYLVIFVLFVYGATQVNIDSNIAKLAKEGTQIQQSFTLADEKMMGGVNLEVLMNFNHADALKDPEVLKTIERWQHHLEQKYPDKIIKTNSLADIVKDTNKVMHNDDPAFDAIPDDPRLTAQLLYLFDNANARDRRSVVSDNYSYSHISFLMRNEGSHAYTEFFNTIEKEIPEFFGPLKSKYPDMEIKQTGSFYLMMKLIDHISWTQIESFSLALLVITVLMIFALGSIKIGLVSMIPNLLPAVFSVGILGLLDISLNLDTLVVAPIIIGIAVDDTIHFLAHYRNAWFEHGDVASAMQKTLDEVGQAVIFTSLVLGVGFSILGFSDYLGLAKPGILGSAAIFVALFSDLLFLPALLYWLKPNLGTRSKPEAQVVESIA